MSLSKHIKHNYTTVTVLMVCWLSSGSSKLSAQVGILPARFFSLKFSHCEPMIRKFVYMLLKVVNKAWAKQNRWQYVRHLCNTASSLSKQPCRCSRVHTSQTDNVSVPIQSMSIERNFYPAKICAIRYYIMNVGKLSNFFLLRMQLVLLVIIITDSGLQVLSFHHCCTASDASQLDRGGTSTVLYYRPANATCMMLIFVYMSILYMQMKSTNLNVWEFCVNLDPMIHG